jgi:hypothetical protein
MEDYGVFEEFHLFIFFLFLRSSWPLILVAWFSDVVDLLGEQAWSESTVGIDREQRGAFFSYQISAQMKKYFVSDPCQIYMVLCLLGEQEWFHRKNCSKQQ